MRIDFINNLTSEYDKYRKTFYYYARKTVKLLEIDDNFLLEIQLVDNEDIQKINREYRNIDKPTDVISFAFNDEVEGEVKIISSEPYLLGMIIISVPKAIEQAKLYGHSLDREMNFLFVHGLLDLFCYDLLVK